jgi:hypothetical protein
MPIKASTAAYAKLMMEMQTTPVAIAALTDSGDHTTFTSASSYFSNRPGYEPSILMDGMKTGGAIIPDGALVNNVVDIAAATYNRAGIAKSIIAGSITITRSVNGGTPCIINSICIKDDDTWVKAVGAEGAALSTVRGAAGGPPLIPVGYVEAGQVKTTSISDGVILASEIYSDVLTCEYASELYIINYLPIITNGAITTVGGSLTFLQSLGATHVGPTARKVYASHGSPVLAELQLFNDFVPPTQTNTTSSTQVCGAIGQNTVGSTASSLTQGSFTVLLQDGITDQVVKLANQELIFQFFPNRYVTTKYTLCQGVLGTPPSYPAGANMSAACTVSATSAAVFIATA